MHASGQFDVLHIGARLRKLRLDSGVSLRALAGRLGISASAISQIETGALLPSVSRLVEIMGALQLPLSLVFDEALAVAPAPVAIPGTEFFESTYPPGAASGPAGEFLAHTGFETGVVSSGRLTFQFSDGEVQLSPGDSICFSAATGHRVVNLTDKVAVATWLTVQTGSPNGQTASEKALG